MSIKVIGDESRDVELIQKLENSLKADEELRDEMRKRGGLLPNADFERLRRAKDIHHEKQKVNADIGHLIDNYIITRIRQAP